MKSPEKWPRRVAPHLFQGESGFYARMAIPATLRPIIGKREFYATIHASSDAIAVRKLHAVVAGFQATIDSARAQAKAAQARAASPRRGRSLSPGQLAIAHYSAQMQFDDECRTDSRYAAHGFVDAQYVAALRDVIAGAADDQGILETLGGIASRYQRAGNLRAPFGSPGWREAARALAVAELESLARQVERDEGDFTGQPSNPLLTAKPEPVASANDPLAFRIIDPDRSVKTLGEILPDFIAERKPTDDTAKQYKVAVRLFEEVLGEDKPVYRITKGDVISFKKALQELPANRTKRFSDLTVPEVIKENKSRAVPFQPIKTKTINNKYLSALRSILAWCANNEVLPDNPATGIKVEARKTGEDDRLPFTPGDLAKIFSSERFKTRPFDETQWAMLISLFTGMRAAEVAQMKLDSIRTERGVLVFAVEEKTKTKKRRLIPVHSILVALGLNDRVTALRAKSATHLLPDWYQKGEAKSNWSAYINKAFNVTTKKNLDITGRKTFHSFRHNFTTGLTHAGVDDAIKRALCGHADQSAHAVYVHGHAVEAMKEAIEKLRFDGFTLA